ncbi:glycosyltransferase family 2 protein [Roseivivax sp. GX 12232]|uniref:glycosyltransferase family 2 protein n=1 Tax=Roseivivax sp. GX 12232 TaxID=2900547 RepID=UPI001E59B382|nr:glycosyltransferase family 2 protein [Roseivivax sp. GX 12232]MCE0504539.1 glycosyltransferase family 2 protein [Roseivivax sp. GX 12232]
MADSGKRLGLEDLWDEVRRVQGAPRPGARKLFVILRDEMAFLPAFLAHYRAIGFEQFLVFDDGSEDGGGAYLEAQEDVVLYRAGMGFGAPVEIAFPDGSTRADRFGTWVKAALPHVEAPGEVVAYFDADEFLILPPGVTSVAEVYARMEARATPATCASLVEFFPEDLAALAAPMPDTPEGLFAAYPYFEAEPLVALSPGAQPDPFGTSKTNRLFAAHGIGAPKRRLSDRLLGRKGKAPFNRSARHKLPFLRRDGESWQVGSHYASLPPDSEMLLTIAHFVFTAEFAAKIERARHWKAHTQGAAKYTFYAELLEKMAAGSGSFLGPRSERYRAPEQLVAAGLMAW